MEAPRHTSPPVDFDRLARRMDSDKLIPEQIKNWRNVLLGMIGPYALMMPDEDVQKMRDNMQAQFSEPNAEVSHRDRERQPAADQPTE